MLIGLVGKAGVGKTWLANYMSEYHQFHPMAFAGPLKRCVTAVFGIDPSDCDSEEKKQKNIHGFDFTLRKALQVFGTEGGRSLDENLWVQLAAKDARGYKRVIFHDVRFKNEVEWIRSEGGLIVEMSVTGVTSRNLSSEEALHASEKFDFDIRPHIRTVRYLSNNTMQVNGTIMSHREFGKLLVDNCIDIHVE